MPNYRLYFMESAAKRFHTLREFEAPGDDLAIALVEDARGREGMELWCGNKRVKAWHAVHSNEQSATSAGKLK